MVEIGCVQMAYKHNIIIDQGADYITTVNLNDTDGNAIDLSDYTVRSQIRKHYQSTNATADFTAYGSNTGVLTLQLSSIQTANIVAGRYVYDAEVVDSSNVVSRIIEGIVTVTPNVTR